MGVSIKFLGHWLEYDVDRDQWSCAALNLFSPSLVPLMDAVERAI